MRMKPVLVSACLLGVPCRFDGKARPCQALVDFAAAHETVPVCPELLGGLRSPREASELDASKMYPCVVSASGENLTEAFTAGAAATVDRAQRAGCTIAVLKAKSPSCGSCQVYDGTFSGALVPGAGVATARLREAGIRVVDECRFEAASPALFAESSQDTPRLETDRLVLRPLVSKDVESVFAYSKDPEVGPNAGWMPHRSIEESLFFIEQIANAPHVFGIFEKGSAVSIGSVGLIPDPLRPKGVDTLMLGYALGKPWWGKGYMTEAAHGVLRYGFDDLQLSMVSCNCYGFNERSARVIEKLGFSYEGCLRSVEATPDGVIRDVRSFSLLRDEYKA
jgi:uncharacterized protein YbbK (DUF523 family)/RimJ/RimL family protein N-acetyltransferase